MNDSKVVFVRPPNLQKAGDWKKQGVIRCPLNLGMLASYIRREGGYNCKIVDFEIIRAGTPEEMADCIASQAPKYVCFTTLTPRFPTVVRTAQRLKEMLPDVVTIVGGPHVSGNPQAAIFDGIDYGVAGEGEQALLELLQCLDAGDNPSNIENLMLRDGDGQVKVNPWRAFIADLDSLPFPAWDLMDIDEYLDPENYTGAHMAIFTGRGCPFNCKFCASAATWKRHYRVRSVDSVIDEIRCIVNELGIRNIMFWDDTVAVNRDRLFEICKRLIEEQIDITYVVQTRAEDVDAELVRALKDSGCSRLHIGVESGNEEILEQTGKQLTKDDMRRAVRTMKQENMPSIASYIIGLPGDTHETIQETIDFAFELDATQSKFMILGVFPGTQYYQLACQKGLVDQFSFDQMEALNYYDSVAINLSNVSDEDLLRYQDQAYARYDSIRGKTV